MTECIPSAKGKSPFGAARRRSDAEAMRRAAAAIREDCRDVFHLAVADWLDVSAGWTGGARQDAALVVARTYLKSKGAECLCGTEGTRYTLGAVPDCPLHGRA